MKTDQDSDGSTCQINEGIVFEGLGGTLGEADLLPEPAPASRFCFGT